MNTLTCAVCPSAIPGFYGISSQAQVSGVCSHKGPCAVNRSVRGAKGMWLGLAEGQFLSSRGLALTNDPLVRLMGPPALLTLRVMCCLSSCNSSFSEVPEVL